MEESKALHKLTEAIDLVGMIEELLSPHNTEKLSGPAWSGIRITLRNIRETMQASHGTLTNELVQRSRNNVGPITVSQQNGAGSEKESPLLNDARTMISAAPTAMNEGNKIQMTRRDLKASLERFIDR